MKNYLYTAREVIDFFDKKLHLKMSESNFTKHKKAKIFKIYKKEGKKGDFYKLPEAAIDFFGKVNQRSVEGLQAMDNLTVYLKEYKAKEELVNRIDEQWEKVIKFPKLDIKMFDIEKMLIDAKEEAKEEFEKLVEYELKGETIDPEDREYIHLQAEKSHKDHVADFRKNIDQYNIKNLEMSYFAVQLIKNSVGKHPSFNHSIFQYDMIEFMAKSIVSPEEVKERLGADLVDGVKIEYLNFYDSWEIGDHGELEVLTM